MCYFDKTSFTIWGVVILTTALFPIHGSGHEFYNVDGDEGDNSGNHEGSTQNPDGFPLDRDVLKLHSPSFHSDIAFVHFIRDPKIELLVWMKSDLCIGCKLQPVALLTKHTKGSHLTATIDTRFATLITVTQTGATYPEENNTYCGLHYHFGLLGDYNLTVPNSISNSSDITKCELTIQKEPVYSFTGVLVYYGVIFFLFFCAAVWFHGIRDCVYKSRNRNEPLINNFSNGLVTAGEQTLTINHNKQVQNVPSTRLKSVDTFRGLAILHLVMGTSGDGQYWFLKHARWYGITVADFMFPWFVFIMGTSIHLSFNILLSKGKSFGAIFKKLVFRSITLFLLGVFIQSTNDLRILRIPGVLQRFGITYFIVASSYLLSRCLLTRRSTERTSGFYLVFRDIVDYLELPLAVLCLSVHLCLTFLLPVPGCPRGYQGPGGPLVGENGELTNCTGGAAGYIDRMFFTEAHIVHNTQAHKVYHTTLNHDPEGILGTFTSIVLCILGLQAGKILHLFSTVRGRIIRLITWGALLITCSAVLSKCTMADGWIPLNKNLWSVSFIALTGGVAFIVETVFHLLIDVTHFWNGAPLFYAGMNSILLYMGADILSGYLPFTWKPFFGNHAEYIIMAGWSMTVWLLIAYYTYKNKIFLKL